MKESQSKFLFILAIPMLIGMVLLHSTSLVAQPANDDCSASALLCPNVALTTGNIGATAECGGADGDCLSAGTWNQCYDVYNSVWFHFYTNGVGGQVTVDISGLSCNDANGDGLNAVLLGASTPCDPTTYAAFSCNSSPDPATGFTLNGASLLPNTQYFIQVNGDLDTTANNGCNFTIMVSGPAVTHYFASSSTDVSCNGGNDGSATATGGWGGDPYNYLWDAAANNQQTSTAYNIPAGTYSCLITDVYGCDTTVMVTVNQPPPITIVPAVNMPSCGNMDGSASVNPNNGTSPYSYLWANGNTTFALNNIGAGTYPITITDAAGCTENFTVLVSEDMGPTVTVVPTNVTCVGGSDGGATAIPGGAGAGWDFTWSNTTENNSTIAGLVAGEYFVTVTNTTTGCQGVGSVIVQEPPPWVLNPSSTPETCAGNDGTASAGYVSGGTGAITYLWQDGQTTPTAVGLAGGSYSCTVSDANGCTTGQYVTVSIIPAVTDAVAEGSEIECGAVNGVITVSGVTDGTPPYTYSLDGVNYQAASEFTGLGPGSYLVFIRDAKNCIYQTQTEIVEPEKPTATYSSVNPICDALGSITIDQPTGGEPPYQVSMDSVAGFSYTDLNEGNYNFTITDNNQCETVIPVVLSLACVDPTAGFSPNGDGNNDTWYIPGADQYPRIEITVFNRWGQRVYYKVNYGTEWDGTSKGVGLPTGTYFYTIFLNKDDHAEGRVQGNVTIVR